MSFVTWKVEKYSYLPSGEWDTTPVVVTDFSRTIVEVNSGDAKDSFSFVVNNFNNNYNNFFQPQDKIHIYRTYNTVTVSTSDILLIGAIKDPPYNRTGSKNEVKVEGFNFSESIFSAITFVDAIGITIPQLIQAALRQVGQASPKFRIGWHEDNPPKTTRDTDFPLVYKSYKNCTLKKMLEELSSSKATGDGNYFWYVDINNKLVWLPTIGGSATQTFNSQTDAYKSIKSAKDTKGIINYVIVKGGRDPAGNGITRKPFTDPVSAAKNGNKYYFYTDPGIQGETLTMQDMDASDITKKGKHTQRTPYTYPFTCSWKATADNTDGTPALVAGQSPTVTNAGEYVSVIRREILSRVDKAGNELISLYKNGKLSIDIGFEAGSKPWGLLELVSATIPEVFAGTKTLRVREISYTSDTDIYSLQEDVGTI